MTGRCFQEVMAVYDRCLKTMWAKILAHNLPGESIMTKNKASNCKTDECSQERYDEILAEEAALRKAEAPMSPRSETTKSGGPEECTTLPVEQLTWLPAPDPEQDWPLLWFAQVPETHRWAGGRFEICEGSPGYTLHFSALAHYEIGHYSTSPRFSLNCSTLDLVCAHSAAEDHLDASCITRCGVCHCDLQTPADIAASFHGEAYCKRCTASIFVAERLHDELLGATRTLLQELNIDDLDLLAMRRGRCPGGGDNRCKVQLSQTTADLLARCGVNSDNWYY